MSPSLQQELHTVELIQAWASCQYSSTVEISPTLYALMRPQLMRPAAVPVAALAIGLHFNLSLQIIGLLVLKGIACSDEHPMLCFEVIPKISCCKQSRIGL